MKNKLIRAAVAAVLAFTLWLFVVTTYRTEVEMTFNVPVILDGESVLEDRGLMLVGDKDLMVQLKLNGNRSELSKLRGSDIIVIVDLTRIYEAGEKSLEYNISFPGDIRNGAIEVVNRSPSYITLQVAQFAEKEIPLVAEVTGKPAAGYEINQAGITLNGNATGTIRIEGAKSIVDQVAMAKVEIKAEGVSQDISTESAVVLCDANGKRLDGDLSNVTVSSHRVKVFAPVLEQREFNLAGAVIPGNGLTAADVKLEMNMTTVKLIGRPSALDKVPATIVVNTFDLGQVTQSGEQVFDIDLSAYPGVRFASAEDGKVTAKLTMPEMSQRTITITLTGDNFEAVPPNKKATYGGASSAPLDITLEGWDVVLQRITQADIRAIINVKNGMPGSYTVEITVEGESFAGVRVVGEYLVPVRFESA